MELIKFLAENALIIVPVLWVIGKMIKSTKKINDEFIPALLGILGGIIAMVYLGVSIESFMQGVLAAGVAVFGHQLLKQNSKTDNMR